MAQRKERRRERRLRRQVGIRLHRELYKSHTMRQKMKRETASQAGQRTKKGSSRRRRNIVQKSAQNIEKYAS